MSNGRQANGDRWVSPEKCDQHIFTEGCICYICEIKRLEAELHEANLVIQNYRLGGRWKGDEIDEIIVTKERLEAENEKLKHDINRYVEIANEHVNENARLREALDPFAKFNDALKEWRFGPSKYLLQNARPEDKPFLRWAEPTPPPGIPGEMKMEIRALEVWPQDFKRAEEALK